MMWLFHSARGVMHRIQRLGSTESGEWQQAIIRLVIVAVVVAYLIIITDGCGPSSGACPALFLTLGYLAIALCNLATFRWSPNPSKVRRNIMLVADVAVTSLAGYLGDESVALFSAIYLWIILGHGVRYGVRYLLAATLLCCAGFGLVLLFTPYWQLNVLSGMGLFFAFLLIPAFVHSLIRQLLVAKERAELVSSAKSAFAIELSHEMRTGLASIAGMSELVGRNRLDPRVVRQVRLIQAASETLLLLADDILDLSRLENGNFEANFESVDLYELAFRVTNTIRPIAREKGLRLQLSIRTATPSIVVTDQRRLTQILVNLLANAVKYTRQGFVELEVTASERLLVFRVLDSGSGIPDAKHLLGKFQQADSKSEGVGLGLSIVDALVDQLEGSLSFEKTASGGSEFRVNLPRFDDREPEEAETICVAWLGMIPTDVPETLKIVPWEERDTDVIGLDGVFKGVVLWSAENVTSDLFEEAVEFGTARAVPILVSEPGWRAFRAYPVDGVIGVFGCLTSELLNVKRLIDVASAASSVTQPVPAVGFLVSMNVLVAEDEPVAQLYIQTVLNEMGCQVTLTADGPSTVAQAHSKCWDIAFVDNQLPGFGGEEVLKRMSGCPFPKVVLSADATKEAEVRALAAGADRYLLKPVAREELKTVLQELVVSKQH